MTSAPPRRVVLDPNVLISAAITPTGSLGRIVTLIDVGAVVPLATQHLVDEVSEVLGRPKLRRYIEPATAEAFCAEFGRLAEWHSEPVDPRPCAAIPMTTTSSRSPSHRTPTPWSPAMMTCTQFRTLALKSSRPANCSIALATDTTRETRPQSLEPTWNRCWA